MNTNCKEKALTDQEEQYIIEQIKYLHGEFVSIQQSFLGIISVSLAVYAVIIYYALTAGKDEIFLILPFLFSLSVYNILKYTIRTMGIDAYVCHLEKLINTAHKKSLFLWQSYMAGANSYAFIGAIPQFPCFAVLGIFLIYRFTLAIGGSTYPSFIVNVIKALLVIQFVFLAIMILHCATQFSAVSVLCSKISPNIEHLADIKSLSLSLGFNPRCPYVFWRNKSAIDKGHIHQKRK